jgi:tryptophan synthase alpha chain
MTPTSSPARLAEIGRQASGFVYCTARKSVTGRRTDFSQGVGAFLERCRAATPLPLGLGIKTAGGVRELRGLADIAIVGTACHLLSSRAGDTPEHRESMRRWPPSASLRRTPSRA